MMDEKQKNTFTFDKSLLVLKDVDVNNKEFKERGFLLQQWFVCYVYVLRDFNNNGVVIELCDNICLVVNMWCVWSILICC